MGQQDQDNGRAPAAPPGEAMRRLLGGRLADLTQFDAGPTARMVSASAVTPGRIEWLWPGRIPLGMLTLFSGDPKLGKSLAAIALAAAVTRGSPLPGAGTDGQPISARGSAILLSAEDDPERTIVPRLMAAGADLDRVHLLSTIVESGFRALQRGPTGQMAADERMPTLSPEDLEVIERRAAALGDCRLIVFDPISAYMGSKNSDVRRALAPLRHLARRLNVAIVLIAHHNKQGASGTNGKYRVLNSIEHVAVCRANFLFLQDPDDPTGRRRLMLDNGVNLAARQPALAFVIREGDAAPFCDWLPETIDLDADGALARAVRASKIGTSVKSSRRSECEQWLRGYLAGGPKPAKECEQAALAAGFNQRLLERARANLAIRCVRSGFGKGACYHLSLAEADSAPPDPSESVVDVHAPPLPDTSSRAEHGGAWEA